ncbi:uncharacterized protein M6B38_403445 [Iris pallida]|uniref:Reverse transcriptase zinc-binding domain-containing protein n=1 Tax=Iris pallida TaxID=29817 RepID=A0AAX6FSZ8_IRIPA|nr:uncharacterized protein M6B38_403445 [Iris pallida]
MRSYMMDNVCWRIRRGWVNIFDDPWIPTLPGYQISKSSLTPTSPKLVRELMDPIVRTWNFSLIHSIFSPMEAAAISSIPLREGDGNDVLIWTKTRNGNFPPKYLYEDLRRQEPGSSSNTMDKNIWCNLWHKKAISPRIQTFIWRLLHKALPLFTAMNKRLPQSNKHCPFCLEHAEDANHLFLHCSVSKAAWFASMIGLRVDSQLDLFKLIEEWLKDRQSKEVFLMGAALLWLFGRPDVHASLNMNAALLWLFGRPDVHASLNMNPRLSLRLYNKLSICIMRTQEAKMTEWSVSTRCDENLKWSDGSPPGYIKINVDGVVSSHSLAAAAIARDNAGMFVATKSWLSSPDHTFREDRSLTSEVHAIRLGVLLANQLDVGNIIIEGDSLTAHRIFKGEKELTP